MDSEGNQILDGKQVASAKAGMTEDKATGSKAYVVSLTLPRKVNRHLLRRPRMASENQFYIIMITRLFLLRPSVRAITGGQCQIDGMVDYEEANNLASTIRIGSLSLELEELRSNVVARSWARRRSPPA